MVLSEHTLVTGEVVLQELGRVLRGRIGLPPGAVKEIDEFLREQEVAAKRSAPATTRERDPDDRWVVASAIESRADVLVTGDQDLPDIAATAPIRIVDPRGFWGPPPQEQVTASPTRTHQHARSAASSCGSGVTHVPGLFCHRCPRPFSAAATPFWGALKKRRDRFGKLAEPSSVAIDAWFVFEATVAEEP